MEMDVKGVSPCPEPIPHAQGAGGCQQQQQRQQDEQPGESASASSASDHPGKRPNSEREDKKRTTANKTSGAPSYSRWSSSQPHQSSSTVRTYQNSKSRVTMSPGFSSQWNNSQPAWNTYTFPRASLHYQSHASYTYCAGHPAEEEFAIQDEYQEVEPQLDQQSSLNKKIAIVSASTTSEFFFCPNLWTK
ncbi:uncharacterized protein LOC112550049 isoform X2 [Alligator sinensis]|uniref:Uncharacterized protein LOC112550049 isoform X2 n=1 Tax=Alligator sinensis TaxID=38654 RepID=A0A3Q0GEN6_ALLSI|nr:uncharacterized protein LOC112550049 isoform X2 [Alligator sinensis]